MFVKILVAVDSAEDLLSMKYSLSEYCILTACNGLEAMRIIEAQRDIDIIILDMGLPGIDGLQILNTLNSDAQYKKIRTIILTNDE